MWSMLTNMKQATVRKFHSNLFKKFTLQIVLTFRKVACLFDRFPHRMVGFGRYRTQPEGVGGEKVEKNSLCQFVVISV